MTRVERIGRMFARAYADRWGFSTMLGPWVVTKVGSSKEPYIFTRPRPMPGMVVDGVTLVEGDKIFWSSR